MSPASQHTARRITVTALQQIALAAAVFLLLAGWLHIPDANAFEVLGSVVIGLLIFAIAGAGETAVALRLTHRPATVRRLLLGTGILLIAVMAWYFLSLGLQSLSEKDGLLAGYLNSKLPARLRPLCTFERLFQWLEWFWSGLHWITGGLLGAVAFACATCDQRLRGLASILRSGPYWLALLLLSVVGGLVTGGLLTWTPGHGLSVELLSLVLRVATVITLDAAVIAVLFHVMAGCILHVQDAGTAAPDTSQPRTADMP